MALYVPKVNDGDWNAVRRNFQKLTSTVFGPTAVPTFAGLTLTDSLTLPYLTEGSVLFAGPSGLVSQDNDGLFWDDTNKRLGIRTVDPQEALDVVGNILFSDTSRLDNTEKNARLLMPSYDIDEEPVNIFYGNARSTETHINIGGGTSIYNTATQIKWWTAPDTTTLMGTMWMALFNNGWLGLNTPSPISRFNVEGSFVGEDITQGITITNRRNGTNDIASLGFGISGTYIKAAIGLIRKAGFGSGDMLFATTTDTSASSVTFAADTKMVLTRVGFLGLLEPDPETLIELTHAQPYLTLHNDTHEDTDGGRESRLIFKGEQGISPFEETELAVIEAAHDGTGEDDLGYWRVGVNTGAGVVDVLKLDSDLLATFAGQMATPVGSEAAPSYAFTGQLDDGMWSPAAGELAWSLGGSEAMRLDATGLGIGTDSPFNFLHIRKTAVSGADQNNDDLIVMEHAGSAQFNFIGGVNDQHGFLFSDTTRAKGQLTYQHSTDTFRFVTSSLFTFIGGNFGIGETAAETLLELTHATPTITGHVSTHSDADGSGAWILRGKREQSGGEETESATITMSHDGSGDDQLAKMVLGVNTGSGVVDVVKINSDATIDMLDHRVNNISDLNISSATELTISSGAVTITQGHHNIDTEGNATDDDLDTINGGESGDVIFILPNDDGRTVRIRHGVGNIYLKHQTAEQSYNFNSPSGGGGTFYVAGYYDWSSTDAGLNQTSPTSVNHGDSNVSYAAHVSIVAGGAGVVDTGVVKITVSGTVIDDEGNRAASQTVDLVADITTLSLNQYVETSEKFLGEVTIALATASGSPVNFNVDINYGFSKYEDIGNTNFSITLLECVGRAGANDTGFNIRLFHHNASDWTYAASGFVPGPTAGDASELANMNTDHSTEQNLSSGEPFAYKRTDLNQDINGNNGEGVVIEITTSAGRAVEAMDAHIGVHSAPKFGYMATTKQHLIFMKHGPNWLEL